MDFDTNGVIDASDTRTFNLDSNVTFDPNFVGTSISFDWRGRSVTGQVTPVLVLTGPATGRAIITISGSGDITMDGEGFPDTSIPDVTLNGNPTGDIRPDILNEKVMSAIIEIKVEVERTEEIINIIWEVEKRIPTQVVIGVGVRCDAEGEENVVSPILAKLGYNPQRAKTNIGLGRKVIRDLTNAAPIAQPKEMVNA